MAKDIFGIIMLFFSFISITSAQDMMGSYEDLSSQIMRAATESDLICLGEESHGDTIVIRAKSVILGDIVGHVPTGAVLFEAPLIASVIAYTKNDSYSEFVWPFWKYRSIRGTLDSIIEANGLVCLGFDPQETCNYSHFSSFLTSEGFVENDVELVKMDSILALAISDGSSSVKRKLTEAESELLEEIIEKIKSKLHWPAGISTLTKELILLCFDNREFLAKQLTFFNVNDQMNYRDSIMALNVKNIKKIINPILDQKKVIIWAANLHIAKKINKGDWMMERYLQANADKVLSIGVISRRRRRISKRFDFTVVSGSPGYMSKELFNNYDCN